MRVVLALLGLGAGCAADTPSMVSCKLVDNDILPMTTPAPATMRFMPLVVGASWTYRFTARLETTTNVVTIEPPEPVEGVTPPLLAYRILTQKAYGAQLVAWVEDRGDQLVSYRELSIDGGGDTFGDERFFPGRPILDESAKHLDVGSSWTTHFADTIIDSGGTYADCKSDQFELQADDDVVTVPAGTFHTIKVYRADSGTTQWFARGVGKVKQTGATTTTELLSFDLP